MGYGDDIMATGNARKARQSHPDAKVVFADPERQIENAVHKKVFHWSPLFENNPNILQPGEDVDEVIMLNDCPAFRPYINHKKTKFVNVENGKKALFKISYNQEFEAVNGEIFFTDDELSNAEAALQNISTPFIIIEPSAKVQKNNKGWIWERWLEVIKRSPYTFVQLGPNENTDLLDGCQRIVTETFRDACAVLNASVQKGLLLATEGGLHHAAAAVNLPAIVLWSHFSHEENLGYQNHINIRWNGAGEPCGLMAPCVHCKRSMEMIKVEDVLLAIETAIKEIR